MNIVILGAGQVGRSLVANLVREDNNITIIDSDLKKLTALQQRYDIRTVHGYASHPDVLRRAGTQNADMLIAVTNSDETNIVGCQIAYKLFHTPMKIARVRANNYFLEENILTGGAFHIDVCISPEQLVTDYIRHLIDYPGASQVLDFAQGRVQLVCIKPTYGGSMVGKSLNTLHESFPNLRATAVAVFRRNRYVPVSGNTILEPHDNIYFMVAPSDTLELLRALGRVNRPYKRIMITGGGRIGKMVAMSLEKQFQVKIIDANPERTAFLAATLDKSIVLNGSGTDRDLLVSENVEQVDVFCALTNDDEANIMSCLQAKRLGAQHTIALINQQAYAELIEGSDIEHAISPQETTIGSILAYLRRGDVMRAYALRHGEMEAIELVAHGDESTSKVVGRRIDDIHLPPGAIIGAIVRDDDVIFASKEHVIKNDDHVIMFIANKRYLPEVERLFQVKFNFFL